MLAPLLWLILTLIPLVFLTRWISRHVQGIGLLVGGNTSIAVIFYFLVMLPGIIVHELSHWLMAKLLGLKTGRMSIKPSAVRGGRVRLGSVQVQRADPLRESLVGLAPLLAGSALLLIMGTWVFDVASLREALVVRDAGRLLAVLGASLRVPDFWIWLYLIFAISNAMLPSESDRQAWLPLGIFLGVVAIFVAFIGWTPQIPAAVVDSTIGAVNYLAIAFLLTLIIDLFFVGVIAGVEWTLGLVTGNRVQY